jgi:hypothetical protein
MRATGWARIQPGQTRSVKDPTVADWAFAIPVSQCRQSNFGEAGYASAGVAISNRLMVRQCDYDEAS